MYVQADDRSEFIFDQKLRRNSHSRLDGSGRPRSSAAPRAPAERDATAARQRTRRPHRGGAGLAHVASDHNTAVGGRPSSPGRASRGRPRSTPPRARRARRPARRLVQFGALAQPRGGRRPLAAAAQRHPGRRGRRAPSACGRRARPPRRRGLRPAQARAAAAGKSRCSGFRAGPTGRAGRRTRAAWRPPSNLGLVQRTGGRGRLERRRYISMRTSSTSGCRLRCSRGCRRCSRPRGRGADAGRHGLRDGDDNDEDEVGDWSSGVLLSRRERRADRAVNGRGPPPDAAAPVMSSHDSCPTTSPIRRKMRANCADGGATIKQSPRLMSLAGADVGCGPRLLCARRMPALRRARSRQLIGGRKACVEYARLEMPSRRSSTQRIRPATRTSTRCANGGRPSSSTRASAPTSAAPSCAPSAAVRRRRARACYCRVRLAPMVGLHRILRRAARSPSAASSRRCSRRSAARA